MKIHTTTVPVKNNDSASYQLDNFSININDIDNAFKIDLGNIQVYLEGEFYYYIEDEKNHVFNEGNIKSALINLFSNNKPSEFSNSVAGMYCGIWINLDEKVAVLFSDLFNQKNLFYTKNNKGFIASTKLKDVINEIDEIKYNQYGLYSYLTLGYTPINDTFYEGVLRLGCDETIRISKDGINHDIVKKERKIIQYDKSHIDLYESYISNAVYSRSSDAGNIVMNSGGWDSTTLTCLLSKYYDKSKISSIVWEVILSDKKSFNIYEVDKVKRISDYFGIKTDKCVIDYNDKNLINIWENNIENLRDNHVYFWIHHLKLADQIGSQKSTGISVFNGEAADSIHNFGFSQFVSVNYDNILLREYADKAKNYLYGPTFFSELLKGTFKTNKVYQFFNYYYGSEHFEPVNGLKNKDLLEKYLKSFMLSYQRVPFAKWQNNLIATDVLREEYSKHLNKKYISNITDNITPDTLYYYLLQLYRIFHFQSAQIAVNQASLRKHEMSCKMPFLDLQMMNFMYSMPENWGRGLELKTTKYPLRYLANERWDMPVHILEEPGPHSYIAEDEKKWTYAGGNWDLYCEIMYKSVFNEYFKEVFNSIKIDDYFDSKYFNVQKMQNIIDDFVNNKEDIPNHSLLYRLALLFSIGLYK